MAFHGTRGVPRGRGSRGGRSRPGGLRGRGGLRRGRGKPIFDSARIAEREKDNSDREESEIETEGKEDEKVALSQDGSSSDSDVEESLATRPYSTLLQSLAVDLAPQAKKRKVDTGTSESVIETSAGHHHESAEGDDVDTAEEVEDGPEIATEGLLEDDDNDIGDSSDPFEAHFADPDDNILEKRLKAIQKNQWTTQKHSISKIGKAIVSLPDDIETKDSAMPIALPGPACLKLKQKLANSFVTQSPTFDSLEQIIAPCLFEYHDLLFCGRSPANSERLRRLICLHAINHVFKTRDRVIKNNARLAKEADNDDLELRDQGFTRPKVLMLLPTRQSCVKMADMITSLCEPDQQENRKRFEEFYSDREEKFSVDKAKDFRELFAGNDDDMFRLGMKFTRKTVKYFSQFYNSDIIFASPLGLRMAIGTEESSKVDNDFLSSIEIVIVDQADALLMQNWEHVEFIFEHLNMQPKEAHGCDFSRVRKWYLDNNARYFRHTIALAAFNTPDLNTLFYNKSENWAGKIKITATYPGALQELGLKVKQTFSRLESPSFSTDPDARFTYFTTAIIPTLTRHKKDNLGTLIFIPSYLEFVRVRNYFSTSASTSSLSFGSVSEYTSVQNVARARSHFLTGRHSVLLYTERAHHFRRYQMRGVRKVIMYGLPDNPIFYKEIVGGYLARSIQEGNLEAEEASVRIIFSKWDVLKLERVAGTERVGRMIKDKGDTFDFI